MFSVLDDVGGESIETGDPENMGITFGITTLSVVERELQALPVWWSPS